MASLGEWYHVSFDDTHVYRNVAPPGAEAWEDSFTWASVIRVCYERSEDFYTPDSIYVFIEGREESFEIPTEASGGTDLWGAIIERKLFDAQTSIDISIGRRQGVTCWPPIEEG